LREVDAVLTKDPHNRSREHDIIRLKDIAKGEGALRLRLGYWRFFFDIYGSVVVLDARFERRSHYRRSASAHSSLQGSCSPSPKTWTNNKPSA
jgi:hypothetical protein